MLLRTHSVQEVICNENLEIRVDTRIKTDIFVYDKKLREIILIEVGITSQDNLQTVEAENKRKYELLANAVQE